VTARRLLTWAIGGLALAAALPGLAGARLVGDFQARVKDFHPSSGAYTVVADARIFDTTGGPAPALSRASVSFPAGARLREKFLQKHYFCDPGTLQRHPDPKLCPRARFATGRIVLDARPEVVESLSASIYLYLGKPAGRGEVASVVALVAPNERTPVYAFQVLRGRLVAGAGKRFGYRLELPAKIEPLLATVTLTLAEIHLTIPGLASHGVFWTTAPRCPRGGHVWFGASYRFEGAAAIRRRRGISCSRLRRNPSGGGHGTIPGAD
jgi:hypothetical protein